MTGSEFIRKVEKFAKDSKQHVHFVPHRGKGSHGTLYLGERRTTVCAQKSELKKGTLHGMLKQLGITPEDIGQ